MTHIDIQDNFSLEITDRQVANFLESENMRIKKIKLIPESNSKQTKVMRAEFTAMVREGRFPKPVKFLATYNNYKFSFMRKGDPNYPFNIELDREWQRYLLLINGKRYLEYHEKRMDAEIKYLKTHRQEILKQKEKEIENTIARLKQEKVL